MPYRSIICGLLLLTSGLCICKTAHCDLNPSDHSAPMALPLDAFEYHPGDNQPLVQKKATAINRLLGDGYWQPLVQFSLKELESNHDLYLRIKLPDRQWEQPAVYMSAFLNGFEFFLGSTPLYHYGNVKLSNSSHQTAVRSNESSFDYFQNHIIALNEAFQNQFLLIRINYEVPNNFGEIYSLVIGSREDIYHILIQEQSNSYENGIKELLLGYLLILIGILSLMIFIIRWRTRDYAFLSFSFFTICVGLRYLNTLNLLLHSHLSPLIFDYIESLTFLLVPVGLFAFVDNVFGPGWRSIVRRLWQFHIFLTLVFLGLTYFHLAYDFRYVPIFLLIGCAVCLGAILKSDRFQHQRIKVIFAGFFSLFIILLLGKLLEMIGIFTLVYDLFGWGTMVLIVALGYILVQHYTETDQRMRSVSMELVRNKNELLKLKQANLESQLEALKNQINPHFLFNTFSTLVSIIEDDRRLAVDYVQELSKIYRYVLQTKVSELIVLKEELDFVKSYEFLLSKRFGDKFQVSITVPKNDYECLLPPLSLQLLIENAVKHNVISSKQPLLIEIYKENHYLVIKNKIQKKRVAPNSTQIGLKNIRDRYRFFTHDPILINADQGHFTVKIPLLTQN